MSDFVDVTLPTDQSEGTRSQVLAWLKAVGDSIAENEPLLEIETDKVTVEIPAPCSGVLSEIRTPEQTEVEAGQVLGRIDRRPGATPPGPQAERPQMGAGSEKATPATTPARAGAVLSPAVRRLLAEHQLEADNIAGSGIGGKILIEDVLRHAGNQTPRMSDTALAAPAAPAAPATNRPAGMSGRLVPHSRMRRQIAERMVTSLLHTAPHVTTVFEVDLTAVLAHRAQRRAEFESRGAALTLTSYFVAACVEGLRAVPELNSRWHADGLEILDQIDIGVATALAGGGLVVPVIHDVAALDLFGVARELGDRVKRAREDLLTPADVRGGTFTISNHGVSGSLLAAPIIINQPQSAILGIGKVEKRAIVSSDSGQDTVVVRPRCYVTLTIDHRVLDGQRANEFLMALTRRLEHWES